MQITPSKKKKNVVKLQYWDSVSSSKVIRTHISLKFWEKKKYSHFEKSWDKLELGQIDQSLGRIGLGQIGLGTNWPVSVHRYSERKI
jgi:hypothetical protein